MHICPQRVFLYLFQNIFRSFSLASTITTPFFILDLSNCVVFDLPNAAYRLYDEKTGLLVEEIDAKHKRSSLKSLTKPLIKRAVRLECRFLHPKFRQLSELLR